MMEPGGFFVCLIVVIDGRCDFSTQLSHLAVGDRLARGPRLVGHMSMYTNNAAVVVRPAWLVRSDCSGRCYSKLAKYSAIGVASNDASASGVNAGGSDAAGS